MTGKVLLVHGLLNATSWLRPLAARLRAHGFAPELFGYSSLLDGPQRAVPRLVERLRREPVDAMVGHSLGGLIALEALRAEPGLAVPRVAAVGVVAGDVARGMGRLFCRFDGASDGTVGLEETRLPGIADHCTVHCSHTGLVFSADAAAQAAHFLRHGRFAQA